MFCYGIEFLIFPSINGAGHSAVSAEVHRRIPVGIVYQLIITLCASNNLLARPGITVLMKD